MPDFEKLWFNQAEVLRDEAEAVTAKALGKAGWKYTSQTPCSVWMWKKEFDGIMYMVSQSDAADIQERSDRNDYFTRYPDEMSD